MVGASPFSMGSPQWAHMSAIEQRPRDGRADDAAGLGGLDAGLFTPSPTMIPTLVGAPPTDDQVWSRSLWFWEVGLAARR